MLTITETNEFIAFASKIWDDAEREEFILWIAEHALDGDVIPGWVGCAKFAGLGLAWASKAVLG